jgi:short subunit fatty acids transporter
LNFIIGFIICFTASIVIISPECAENKYVNRKKIKRNKNKKKKVNLNKSTNNNSIINQKKFHSLIVFIIGFIIMLVKF